MWKIVLKKIWIFILESALYKPRTGTWHNTQWNFSLATITEFFDSKVVLRTGENTDLWVLGLDLECPTQISSPSISLLI